MHAGIVTAVESNQLAKKTGGSNIKISRTADYVLAVTGQSCETQWLMNGHHIGIREDTILTSQYRQLPAIDH